MGCEWSPKADLGTLLVGASFDGNAEMVNVLLEQGVNPNTRNEGGITPLIWSTVAKHKEIVKSLLVAGADPNFIGTDPKGFRRRPEQFSPLYFATFFGRRSAKLIELEILKDLLDAGANVNSKDGVGRTPLSWAAERRSKSVLQILLDAGSEIDSVDRCNRTPLFYATINNNVGAVKVLLERGSIGTTVQTSAGRNPLDVVRELKFSEIEQLLLKGLESRNNPTNTNTAPGCADLSDDEKGEPTPSVQSATLDRDLRSVVNAMGLSRL
ncbi:kinase-like protein [Penicillium samsonianum]|uniref:kinase-like protein n=1 Tax=Penicillium samsonianum TaxID=1882272 RepID=UPI0025489560|nr:kinase-like protein [Penicillium samsonianum]KAJ6138241.1 kinase-like protein [Penicillium samsonianum]